MSMNRGNQEKEWGVTTLEHYKGHSTAMSVTDTQDSEVNTRRKNKDKGDTERLQQKEQLILI